ncbi:MAG: peptidase domain-containing ABC transporter [Saprospiraceae bacterium]
MNANLKRHHTRQHDQRDCGVACLRSVLRYHGSDASVERLREMSGTTREGTTMLGLLQAAQKLGLEATGYEADLDSLRACTDLCVLHIVKEGKLQHYIVFYKYDIRSNTFYIGDPAEPNIQQWTAEQLEAVWQSKSLLLFKPTAKFQQTAANKNRRWYWIKTLIQEDLNTLGVALAIGIAVAALGLATAIFSQQLIDKILPAKDTLRLFSGVALLLFLLLARSGFSYLRQLLLLRQSRDFNSRIIDYFYTSLLFLPKSFFDNRKTGDLVARMNDTQRIQRTISRLVGNVMIDMLIIVIAAGAIFTYDWQIGLVTLVWIPVFAGVVYAFHAKILAGQQAVMNAYALNESNYIDTMQGIGDIKVTNKQSVFARLTKTVYGFFQQTMLDLGKVSIRFNLVTEVVGAIFVVSVITWSAVNVLNDSLSTGGMIAILQMVSTVMASVGALAMTHIQLQEAKVAFDRMYEFTSAESEYDEESEQPKAQIQDFTELKVQNLAFRFPGRKRLLHDVSFEVKKGEWIAILGESGCGKSTLLQVLQKFYTAEAGKIKVNGIDLDLVGFNNWRGLLGVVPQQVKLFTGTLLDNILLGETIENPEAVATFFQYYGFDRYFSQLPQGYATILGEGGINLSGGQQQIVALARALYRKPQLLLLDEPTSALDRNTEAFVLNLLQQLKPDTAILVTTHRLKTARCADRIYLIENGSTHLHGNHQELLLTENLYSQAWNDFYQV